MSIYKVNTKNTLTNKIELINDMIKEVNGKVEQGKFDINELNQIFTDSSLGRKYLRNVSLGNTVSTYTNWSHLQTEVGYSIWKLTPTSYSYDSTNQLYFDNIVLDNRGQATAESATSFDYVYLYNGDSGAGYTDDSTEAASESGTEFNSLDSQNDYLYLGEATTFEGIKFEFHTRGSGYTLKIEYYSDESGVDDWVQLTSNADSLVDNTSNFESDGLITFTAPANWATNTVNSQTKYWIRISTTATPTTTAKIYSVIPGNSVIGLLALSATQIQEEDWAWCSYSSSIYVTVRNEGNSNYEGNAFIKSGSSTTNLQNFFIYNHTYKLDHKDSTYDAVKTISTNTTLEGTEGVILVDASSNSVVVTLPAASGNEGLSIFIKALTIGGSYSAVVDAESGGTIDDSASYTFSSNYKAILVVSNGTEWYIIGGY